MDIILAVIGLIAAMLIVFKVDRVFRRPDPVLDLAERNLMDRDIANWRRQREAEEQERMREANIRGAAPPIPWQKVEKSKPDYDRPSAARLAASTVWTAGPAPSIGAHRQRRPAAPAKVQAATSSYRRNDDDGFFNPAINSLYDSGPSRSDCDAGSSSPSSDTSSSPSSDTSSSCSTDTSSSSCSTD